MYQRIKNKKNKINNYEMQIEIKNMSQLQNCNLTLIKFEFLPFQINTCVRLFVYKYLLKT